MDSLNDCDPRALALRWSNGHGTLLVFPSTEVSHLPDGEFVALPYHRSSKLRDHQVLQLKTNEDKINGDVAELLVLCVVSMMKKKSWGRRGEKGDFRLWENFLQRSRAEPPLRPTKTNLAEASKDMSNFMKRK
ncbi:uncharacterized protein RSE6_11986 [Rhynchosporium secalis]|uniref:Uncharacterized protein n=1 Tax=Rhynchosporium secalis TaxID=38038 RepID=A0A1E1MPA3_RHYSE|nr:uncharacterized protein RSE6_11986 [Rhynchosporium secalis]